MDKRLVMAAGLSVLILLAWSYLFPPPKRVEQRPVPEPIAVDSSSTSQPRAAEGAEPSEPAPPPSEPIAAGSAEDVHYESRLLAVTLTNRGARCLSWQLREYTTTTGEPLELLPQFDLADRMTLAVDLEDEALEQAVNGALYRVERQRLEDADGERITFSWSDGQGVVARKSLTFQDSGYLVDIAVEITDRGRTVPVRVILGPGFAAQEPPEVRSTYYYSSQAVWNGPGGVARLKQSKLMAQPGGVAGELRWAGLEDQYFTALLVPGAGRAEMRWRPVELPQPASLTPEEAKQVQPAEPVKEPLLSVTVGPSGGKLYIGPKKYTLLRELGHDLQRVVWFASNTFLAWVSRFIFLCLLWIHDHTIPNYGVAIILATFLLRLVLFPVNQYSMVTMKKAQIQMQRLQPKIKAIKTKHSKNKDAESRARMNQEMMDLYRREGVNPMGGLTGCLPLLAQFPILIGFYNMLTVAIELRGAEFFGWIHDLSRADPYWITPILMGITMFLQQKMAMSKVKDPMQLQQQRMMMFMPVVFTWICLQMPSGMVLYWFVNNVLGIAQQWLVNRHTARFEAAAQKA